METRTALKLVITIVVVAFAPAIARSRLVLVPRQLANDPASLADLQRRVTFGIRAAAIVVLVFSLIYQHFIAR